MSHRLSIRAPLEVPTRARSRAQSCAFFRALNFTRAVSVVLGTVLLMVSLVFTRLRKRQAATAAEPAERSTLNV